MAPLTPRPKIKLSRLRDIGWSLWDPIGLLPSGGRWHSDECFDFADEYDSYLLQAAAMLRDGLSDAVVVKYLVNIEAEHMGLGKGKGTIRRAQAVISAIRADTELWTYSDR